MPLGSGEGSNLNPQGPPPLVVRSRRVVTNRFDYIEPRDPSTYQVSQEPGLISPLALTQPSVPTTRAEKERARCAADYIKTVVDMHSPAPPLRPKVSWPQSQAQAPMILTTARSRTSLLSEKLTYG